jgi:hypothetical protein
MALSNTLRIYQALDENMMTLHGAGDDGKRAENERKSLPYIPNPEISNTDTSKMSQGSSSRTPASPSSSELEPA